MAATPEIIVGVGTLTINSIAVGQAQDLSIKVSSNPITLQTSYDLPEAVASGPKSIKCTFKNASLDLGVLAVVLNLTSGAMTKAVIGSVAPTTGVTWVVPIYVSSDTKTTATFTFGPIAWTGVDFSAANTKYLEQSISFDVFAAASTGTALSIAVS